MRLAMVTHYFESHRGGVEIVAGRLARELARTGIDVTWLATRASDPPDDAAVRAVPLAAGNALERRLGVPYPIPTPSSFRRILREVRAADAVLVHDSLYLTSVAAFLAARWHGRPVLFVQHIGLVPYRNPVLRGLMALGDRLVARPMLARADRTVFISETTARHFAGLRWRAPPDLVYNGVDTGLFHPVADDRARQAARRDHGLPPDGTVVLFVGRFVEKKGLPAVERLARGRPDITFALAGWGREDPRLWSLPNVHVFTTLSGNALASLYRASDLLVLPSTGEGFPLVVQEALACGLPVVCGLDTAAADPEAAGFLAGVRVDPDDWDGTAARFADALDRALPEARDPARRRDRAAVAAGRWSWERAAARYRRMLEDLTAPAQAVGRARRPA